MKSKASTEDQMNTRSFSGHMSPTREVKGKVLFLHQETSMRPPEINELSHPPPRKKLPCHSPDTYGGSKEGLCRRSAHSSLLVKSSGNPTLNATSTNRSNPVKYRLCPRQQSSIPPSFSAQPIHSDSDCSESGPQSPTPTANLHQKPTQFMRDVSNYTPSFNTRRDKVHKHKDTMSSSKSKNETEKHRSSNKMRVSEPHSPTLSSHCQKLSPSTNCSGSRSLTPIHRPGDSGQHHRKKPTSSSAKLKSEILNGSSHKRRRESDDCEEPLGASPVPASKDSSTLKQSNKKDIHQLKSLRQSCRYKPTSSTLVPFIKQLHVRLSRSDVVRLLSPSVSPEERLEKSVDKNDQRTEVSTLLCHKVNVSKPSATTQRSKTVSSASKSDSKINSGSRVEQTKTARRHRSSVLPNDLMDLFTPDPVTHSYKISKSNMDEKTVKSSIPEKSTEIKSSVSAPGSSCDKTQNCTVKVSTRSKDAKVSISRVPTVSVVRIKPEDIAFRSDLKEVKNAPVTTATGQHHGGCEKLTALVSNNVTLDTDAVTSQQTHGSSVVKNTQSEEDDSIDMDINLDWSLALDLDSTQSSHSSEEEQLVSLQEIMERAAKPPDTPEKGAFSEPSTPGNHRPRTRRQLKTSSSSFAKPASYKNNIDQIVREFATNKRTKEVEEQFLSTCRDDLLRIAEYEEAQEEEQPITTEQQEFLQHYTLMSTVIREVPPGDAVFNLEKCGCIFNPDTLQLRQCILRPQGAAQKTLLWSSPAQFRSHVIIGLFQEAYDCHSPCPTQVSLFLFKMMSVHPERLISEKILQALSDIACTAAAQIVEHGNQQFKVWVPSLADVTLILMNMGASFVSLFPFENLQPSFTEADLLEDMCIKNENPSHENEQNTFSEHNYDNILKYLSVCMGLCPRAYSDDELLLLLTVLGKVSLDTQLILHSSVELFPLQYKLINNIRDWEAMLPKMCSALTDLTDDHHNMCLLVQQLPNSKRGKELRQHLSLSMISKLINGKCTYKPTGTEFQLSLLKQYLPFMRPSTILKGMLSSSSSNQDDTKEDMSSLDQQSFYLCYSLLTLTNEASNFYAFPAQQKEHLHSLCSKLDSCVKCDIRESEKCLYRSKVKDLVARIDIRWQMVLQKTRPLHDKLYDYWQPRSPRGAQHGGL